MPLPVFADHQPAPRPATLTRTQAAARLGLNPAAVDKLIAAHVLSLPPTADEIERLASRDRLVVTEGELTVLRTDSRADADPANQPPTDTRRWVGFDAGHSDPELGASSLRWWRCDPHRVEDNELFVVTIGTVPVATYRIRGLDGTHQRSSESWQRYSFDGQLLARMHHGLAVRYYENTPGHLKALTRKIMTSRIVVNSGGPIGYLEP
jgi:hypothetical protein